MPRRAVAQAVPAIHAKHPRIDQHVRSQIVSGKWKPDSQIPTYDKLEEMFSVSRVTVMEAIARLKHDGFLISGGPRGVFVASHPPHRYNLGLVFRDDPESPASWSLFSHYVLQATRKIMEGRPGKVVTYHGVRRSDTNEGFQLLTADLKAHRLGSLLFVHTGGDLKNTAPIKQKGIARAMIASSQPLPGVPSIYHDPQTFINQSLSHLKTQGVKRVAVLVGGSGDADGELVALWRQRVEAHGLTTHNRLIHHVLLRPQGWASHIVQAILAAERSVRPDGLIITDDHFVESATHGVKASGVNAPDELKIVAYTNFPWPTQALVPVTRMGVDVNALVKQSIELLDCQHEGRAFPEMIRLPVIVQEIDGTVGGQAARAQQAV